MFTSLTNLFFPPVCAGCEAFLLTGEHVICSRCRHEIPLTGHHLNPENEAFRKFYGKIDVQFAAAFMHYHKRGIVQQIIHNLKYRGIQEIGTVIGSWYASELEKATFPRPDQIIPVPLHRRKLRERGYNQVVSFGQALADSMQIPLNENLLVRNRYAKTQTAKNLLGRTDVSRGEIFDVVFSKADTNLHFLLVDDVLTTGSTLEACSRALLKIPGAKISILCMAMSHS